MHARRPFPLLILGGLGTLLSLPLADLGLRAQSPEARARTAQAVIPTDFDEVLFGAKKHPHTDFVIDGKSFRGVASLDAKPVYAWLTGDSSGLDGDVETASRFVARARKDLGLDGFDIAFEKRSKFRTLDVLEFRVQRGGTILLDTTVDLYFRAGQLIGLHHNFPLPLLGIDAGKLDGPGDTALFAERVGPEGYRIVPARVETREERGRKAIDYRTARGVVYTRIHAEQSVVPLSSATFNEHTIPAGSSFPDQIWADSTGLIWISQPQNNYLTSFDPETKKWVQYPTVARGADGLWVDDQDRVWTGFYFSREVGFLDVPTKKVTRIPMPYSPASPAIPSPSSQGTIWFTDHAYNRISELDPATSKWVGSHVLPIQRTWVVEGCLDPGSETVYFTGNFAHTLPFKPLGQPIGNVSIPSRRGPAFPAFRDGKVWYSNWNGGSVGAYDVDTKRVTEYVLLATERGGPISTMQTGEIVVGTRSAGYISVFDPVAQNTRNYKIPTSVGLKDGLTVAPDGTIWFTGTSTRKLGQLVIK